MKNSLYGSRTASLTNARQEKNSEEFYLEGIKLKCRLVLNEVQPNKFWCWASQAQHQPTNEELD